MKKRKVQKTRSVAMVARDLEEVTAFIHKIAEAQRQIDEIKSSLNRQVAKLQQEAEEEIQPIVVCVTDHFEGIRIFAEANRDALTVGGKKTTKLPSGDIGWRRSPPHVQVSDKKRALAELKANKLLQLIRTIEEPDKEKILKNPELIKNIKGLKVKGGDEFFFIRLLELDVEITDPKKLLKRSKST